MRRKAAPGTPPQESIQLSNCQLGKLNDSGLYMAGPAGPGVRERPFVSGVNGTAYGGFGPSAHRIR